MNQAVQVLLAIGGTLPWLAVMLVVGVLVLAWQALRSGRPFKLSLPLLHLEVRSPPSRRGGQGG